MRRFCHLSLIAGAVCLWSTATLAGKFTGTATCSKPDPQHMVPVGDRPEHSLGVEQAKCTWTKPIEIGGDKSRDGVSTDTVEASGGKMRFHGVHLATMESGAKVAFPYQGGGSTSKDGKETHSKGTFTIGDASGKLKGIKGKGTFSCASSGEDLRCEIEGEYEAAK
jgi:hypothetical protein